MGRRRKREKFCNASVLRILLAMAVSCVIGQAIGPPLAWKLREALFGSQTPCPCSCDCSLKIELSLPLDCGKNDTEMNLEWAKGAVDLLSEELQLQEQVTNETLARTRAMVEDAKTASLHYEKENEKCSLGVGTCEKARESAEAELVDERRLCELWERRAKELGWRDDKRVYT